MKALLFTAALVCIIPGQVVSADKPARISKFGQAMSPHQIAVEDLAKKHFGKDFDYIVHTEGKSGDVFQVTCHVKREHAKAPTIQKAILEFASAYHLAGFKSKVFQITYETRVPDDLGNDKLTLLADSSLRQGLAAQANWKFPEKIKFHALFSSSASLPDFQEEWKGSGAASKL